MRLGRFGRGGKSVVARVRGMGGALLGVVGAEISALAAELAASGRSLARALVLFGIGFAFAFWTLGLLVYFAIELLALKVARWGAVGIVFALFAVVAAGLLGAALARLRRIESPAATVDRRLQGHLAWWQERIGGAPAPVGGDEDDDFDDDEELP
jgi:uncharacterized membrane protein YqjE